LPAGGRRSALPGWDRRAARVVLCSTPLARRRYCHTEPDSLRLIDLVPAEIWFTITGVQRPPRSSYGAHRQGQLYELIVWANRDCSFGKKTFEEGHERGIELATAVVQNEVQSLMWR
jgi:hypothetical protein